MQIKIQGRFDIRPRDDTDIENQNLPYDMITVNKTLTNILTTANDTVSADDSDWGTDLDFYLASLVFLFEADGEWAAKSGPFVRIDVNGGEMLFMETLDPANQHESIASVNQEMRFTRDFGNFRKILNTETIDIYIENLTGQTFSNIEIGLQGVPI